MRSMWIFYYEEKYIFMMKTMIRNENLNYKEDSRKKELFLMKFTWSSIEMYRNITGTATKRNVNIT